MYPLYITGECAGHLLGDRGYPCQPRLLTLLWSGSVTTTKQPNEEWIINNKHLCSQFPGSTSNNRYCRGKGNTQTDTGSTTALGHHNLNYRLSGHGTHLLVLLTAFQKAAFYDLPSGGLQSHGPWSQGCWKGTSRNYGFPPSIYRLWLLCHSPTGASSKPHSHSESMNSKQSTRGRKL